MPKKNRHTDRALAKADEFSVYGRILESSGHNRFIVQCADGVKRTATIRGNMIKRVWIKEKDLVLCSLREGNGSQVDIALKYTDDEIKMLKDLGEIKETTFNSEKDDETIANKVDFNSL